MCSNFICRPINLIPPRDISFESITSVTEKKACDKQIKIELNLESDTDFQSFLLPLEQDLTKSSKGYASLLTTIPNKDTRSVVCKNKFEESEVILLSNEKISDYCNKYLHDNSPCSSGDDNGTSSSDNLYCKKYTQLIPDALDNFEIDSISESNSLKSSVKTIHCSPRNSHNSGYVIKEKYSKENKYLKKCIKAVCDFSVSRSNSSRFIDNQSDDCDNSESSKSDSFSNGSSNSQNYDDYDSSSDDSIIFCDEVVENKDWCSTIKIEQDFAAAINSESSDTDNDSLEESEESSSAYCSEDFEFGFVGLNRPNMASQKELHNHEAIIVFKSEGYINTCFEEDDDFLIGKSSVIKSINENWNDMMKNVSGEPRESKRVSFMPLPDLVSVFSYEPEDDDYHYSLYVLDQLRFQNRIKDFELIIAPFLTAKHRKYIYQKNCHQD